MFVCHCLFVCLSVRMSVRMSVCSYVCQFVCCLLVCLSVRMSVCSYVCQFVCLSVRMSVCSYVCVFECLSVRISVCSYVYQFVCLSVRMSVSSFACLIVWLLACLFVCLLSWGPSIFLLLPVSLLPVNMSFSLWLSTSLLDSVSFLPLFLSLILVWQFDGFHMFIIYSFFCLPVDLFRVSIRCLYYRCPCVFRLSIWSNPLVFISSQFLNILWHRAQ